MSRIIFAHQSSAASEHFTHGMPKTPIQGTRLKNQHPIWQTTFLTINESGLLQGEEFCLM